MSILADILNRADRRPRKDLMGELTTAVEILDRACGHARVKPRSEESLSFEPINPAECWDGFDDVATPVDEATAPGAEAEPIPEPQTAAASVAEELPVDPVCVPGPWVPPDDTQTVESLGAAPWKVVDLETTGLTPASEPVKLTKKKLKEGHDPRLRMRILSASWPEADGSLRHEAWDIDTLSAAQRADLARAALRGVYAGHNSPFDLGWLLPHGESAEPDWVLDTLLLARIAAPESAIHLRVRAADEGDLVALELAKKGGGWSLDALSYLHLGLVMDKTYQKPSNWTGPAPLSQAHYDYASGDTSDLLRLMLKLFGADEGTDLIKAFERWRATLPAHLISTVDLYTRAPMSLAQMRLRGMLVSPEAVNDYVEKLSAQAEVAASKLVELAPNLAPYADRLVDPDAGVTDDMREALAQAFRDRGVEPSLTETGKPQVGEKDLRGQGATQGDAAELFEALTTINRSAKRTAMARAYLGFATRSGDGRVHGLFSPTTNTTRLSSSEPNGQNAPGDQGFRNIFVAPKGKKIVSCDYSALDVRVGSALAIREQRRIARALSDDDYRRKVYGNREQDILEAVHLVHEVRPEDTNLWKAQAEAAFDNREWNNFRHAKAMQEKTHFALALRATLVRLGDGDFARGWSEFMSVVEGGVEAQRTWEGYSALRNAFKLGMDIHSYTAMHFAGRDPDKELEGLSGARLKARMGDLKEELGKGRKRGKVANLSLLYLMTAESFRRHAAKVFDEHFEDGEAESIIADWFAAYVEIDLLAASLALRGESDYDWQRFGGRVNRQGAVRMYDVKRGAVRRSAVWDDWTLTGRPIIAAGLNSAANYPDQGTGADILTRVMDGVQSKFERRGIVVVNQVHDELVFEVDEKTAEDDARDIQRFMIAEGDRVLGPFGVPMDATASVGDVWIKD